MKLIEEVKVEIDYKTIRKIVADAIEKEFPLYKVPTSFREENKYTRISTTDGIQFELQVERHAV